MLNPMDLSLPLPARFHSIDEFSEFTKSIFSMHRKSLLK